MVFDGMFGSTLVPVILEAVSFGLLDELAIGCADGAASLVDILGAAVEEQTMVVRFAGEFVGESVGLFFVE